MSTIPADLRYATSHEWARLEADGTVTIGISDHAQEALGDVVFIELPEVGKTLTAGQEAGVVESVKAASDIYTPVGGEVIAINQDLADSPRASTAIPMPAGSSSSSQAMPASWTNCWMRPPTRRLPTATPDRLAPNRPVGLVCAHGAVFCPGG